MDLVEVAATAACAHLRDASAVCSAVDDWSDVDGVWGWNGGALHAWFATVNTGVLVLAQTAWDEPVAEFEAAEGGAFAVPGGEGPVETDLVAVDVDLVGLVNGYDGGGGGGGRRTYFGIEKCG